MTQGINSLVVVASNARCHSKSLSEKSVLVILTDDESR